MGRLDILLLLLSEHVKKKKKVWGKLCFFPLGKKKGKKTQRLQLLHKSTTGPWRSQGVIKTGLCVWAGDSHFKDRQFHVS